MKIEKIPDGVLLMNLKKLLYIDTDGALVDYDEVRYRSRALATIEGELYNGKRDVKPTKKFESVVKGLKKVPNAFLDFGVVKTIYEEFGEDEDHCVGKMDIHKIKLYHLGV